MSTHSEWAYSQGLIVPAELVSTDPAAIEALVRRDLDGQRDPAMYRRADPAALNSLNVCVVRRSGDPAPRPEPYQDQTWQTVLSEAPSLTTEGAAKFYDIAQTWSEGTLEDCKAMARADNQAWLNSWRNSEFTHSGTVYNANQDQELRLTFTDSGARIDPTQFSTSWYAKDGTKVEFPNQATWNDFVRSALGHVNAGNAQAEACGAAIDSAANTAALDSALAALPTVPGMQSTRATGPLPGGQVDAGATEPKKVRR